MQTHFVTGATGFVGANLILELLSDPSARILALVRPGKEGAAARLREALSNAAACAGMGSEMEHAIRTRCTAIEGDLSQEHCGIGIAALPQVDEFWHSAASLRYEDRYEAEIFETNVEGTRNALDLARRCGVRGHFNYVSTAYVAGMRTGEIEERIGRATATNNHYERSKIEAEGLVAAETDFATRIFRPSIVIGHSRTLAVSSGFSGLYGFMRRLRPLERILRRLQKGLESRMQLRIVADPEARVNLIPVDLVAKRMVEIARGGSVETVFHITNPEQPTVRECLRVIFSEVGLPEPVYVSDKSGFDYLDEKLDEALDFYGSYLRATKLFSRANADAVSPAREPEYRMDEAAVKSYASWYGSVLHAPAAQWKEAA